MRQTRMTIQLKGGNDFVDTLLTFAGARSKLPADVCFSTKRRLPQVHFSYLCSFHWDRRSCVNRMQSSSQTCCSKDSAWSQERMPLMMCRLGGHRLPGGMAALVSSSILHLGRNA